MAVDLVVESFSPWATRMESSIRWRGVAVFPAGSGVVDAAALGVVIDMGRGSFAPPISLAGVRWDALTARGVPDGVVVGVIFQGILGS